MILVDSSVWIDFFSPVPGSAGKELHRMIYDAEPFAVTGVVVAEILQGLTREVPQIERYLAVWEMLEPRGFATYREAAAILRLARAKGINLVHHRCSDCLDCSGASRRCLHAGQRVLPHRSPDESSLDRP